jgi:Zn-dependent M28 family amino/carboxypeptidase
MKTLVFSSLAAVLLGAAPPQSPISSERIKADDRALSADAFAGRGPGEPGEARTVAYLAHAFAEAGLEPAGERGGWFQDVPMVRLDRQPGARLSVRIAGKVTTLRPGPDAALTLRNSGRFTLANAPLMFAGWGIVDPARGWNAYDGVDLHGKVVVLLANDPDFEADRDLGFEGRALAFVGRTGTKVAAAAKAGAVGALVIHEEAAFSWPYAQAGSGDALPSFAYAPLNPSQLGFTAIVRKDVAVALLNSLGYTLSALKVRARSPSFRAFPLRSASVSVDGANRATPIVSRNVLAKLRGASRPDEYVLYGAHWDANGRNGPDRTGDAIRNGAIDNATGTAEVLELARAFKAAPRPARTTVFAAWTSEKKGLLGSEWFAAHPLIPLERTAAVINLDPHVNLPAARNIELIGPGKTDLEQVLGAAAASAGLRVDSEPNPEAGWYFRSDQYSFALRGVPVITFRAGRDLLSGGTAAGQRIVSAFNRFCYHQPCDEFDPRWTFAGPAQEALVAFRLGQQVANDARWPSWYRGNEFRRLREQSAPARR